MSHTVPKRRDGDADDLSVDLSVGIDDRRQLTLDQHHELSAKRWHSMFILQPAPFPTESAPQLQPLMRIRGMPGCMRRTVL